MFGFSHGCIISIFKINNSNNPASLCDNKTNTIFSYNKRHCQVKAKRKRENQERDERDMQNN